MPERIDAVKTSFLGKGAVQLLKPELQKMGVTRALLVTDRFLYESGAAARVAGVLSDAGVEFAVYYNVQPNPTVQVVNECIAAAAGTGSECTSFYIVTDPIRHSKMAMVDTNCMVSIAVNDTDFMRSMPPKLTAATGMDAMTHAIEAVLSRNASPLTDKDALWAIEAITTYLPIAVENGGDEQARTMMAYAENVAGMAFSNAGLGMVHAMAHALGGRYNLPHGVCNAVLLPFVLAFDAQRPEFGPRFQAIARAMKLSGAEAMNGSQAAGAVVAAVGQLNQMVGISASLRELNKVDPAHFPSLAELAMQDTCMGSNLISVSPIEIIAVYTAAYTGAKR